MAKAITYKGKLYGIVDESEEHLIQTLKAEGFTIEDSTPCPVCGGMGTVGATQYAELPTLMQILKIYFEKREGGQDEKQ